LAPASAMTTGPLNPDPAMYSRMPRNASACVHAGNSGVSETTTFGLINTDFRALRIGWIWSSIARSAFKTFWARSLPETSATVGVSA
jgi:hypothetical protein